MYLCKQEIYACMCMAFEVTCIIKITYDLTIISLLITQGPDIRAKGIVVVRGATLRPYLYSISADANEAISTNRREVVSLPTNRQT